MLKALGLGPRLREHELQLIAAFQDERRAGLGADADPVDAVRHRLRAVGFDRDAKPALVQRLEERRIELQERLAAGADDEAVLLNASRPGPEDCLGEQWGAREAPAPRAVGADEGGVTEAAHRARAILLPPRPEIAPSKPQEYRGRTRVRPFALQRVEDLLDAVHGRIIRQTIRRKPAASASTPAEARAAE